MNQLTIYPVAVESLCFLALLFTMWLAMRAKTESPIKLRLYFILGILVASELLLESADIIISYQESAAAVLVGLRKAVNFLGFLLLPIVPFFYALLRNKSVYAKKNICSIPALANIVLLIVNFFYPFIYGVDSSCVYYRGSFFWVESAIISFYIFLIFLGDFLKLRRHKVDADDIALVGGCYLLPILGSIFQVIWPSFFAIWPSVSLSCILYFLFMSVQEAKRDQLTGVFNRMTFVKRMGQIGSKGKIGEITIGVFDINCFKKINDTLGHSKGDECLNLVARILVTALGKEGLIFRTGGDEFCFIGENLSHEELLKAQEELKNRFYLEGDNANPIFIAQGYSSGRGDDKDAFAVYNRADLEMYVDKEKFKESAKKVH